jgi:hypothetical protein
VAAAVLSGVLLLTAAGCALAARRRPAVTDVAVADPAGALVRS